MKRTSVVALIVSSFFLIPGHAEAQYGRTSDGNGWSVQDVKQSIRQTEDRWHVPGGVQKAFSVAKCESGFRPRGNDSSCCHGVFQQHEDYWNGRFHRLNPHHGWRLRNDIHNARSNIVISIRMASRTGWSDWSCS